MVESGTEFKLFWNINNTRVDVTKDPRFAVEFADTDFNGIVDQMKWTVPQLSEQEFDIEADIQIINVQSYPSVGGKWKVRFTTNGTADLRITAIDGTTFGESLPDDLKFLELNNGTHTLTPVINGSTVTYYNYSSALEGFEESKVLTSGEHHLMFEFGNSIAYANNEAVYTDFKIQRGNFTITGTTGTITSAGGTPDFDVCTGDCFIKLVNTRNSGTGVEANPSSAQDPEDWTVRINGVGGLTTPGTVTFERDTATNDSHISWEIWEYTGKAGGANQMVVHTQTSCNLPAFTTSCTGSSITNNTNNVVVFITGVANTADNRNESVSSHLITSEMNGSDQPVLTRIGSEFEADVSYAVVEFNGTNWKTQRVEHTYTGDISQEETNFTQVNSIASAFLHNQMRMNNDAVR